MPTGSRPSRRPRRRRFRPNRVSGGLLNCAPALIAGPFCMRFWTGGQRLARTGPQLGGSDTSLGTAAIRAASERRRGAAQSPQPLPGYSPRKANNRLIIALSGGEFCIWYRQLVDVKFRFVYRHYQPAQLPRPRPIVTWWRSPESHPPPIQNS